jgi:hypothetical protein
MRKKSTEVEFGRFLLFSMPLYRRRWTDEAETGPGIPWQRIIIKAN